MDELRIDQLTKEMVAEQLRILGDPCAAAAAVVRKTLTTALQTLPPGSAPPARVIQDAVKGGMTALLLADQSLARGSVLMLEAVHEAVAERQLDTTKTMDAALAGLADIRRFVTMDQLHEVRRAIEQRYTGAAGSLFAKYVAAAIVAAFQR